MSGSGDDRSESDYITAVDNVIATALPFRPISEENGTSSENYSYEELRWNTYSQNSLYRSDYSTKVDNMMLTPFPGIPPSVENITSSRELKEGTNSIFSTTPYILPSTTPPIFPSTSSSENEISHTAHNSGLMLAEQQSLIKAVDELCIRPRTGKICEYADVNWEEVCKRLKFLSQKPEKLSIDEAIEICDASVLVKFVARYMDNQDPDEFKIVKKYQESIILVGQIANNGVLLMLQAKILEKKGRELLDLTKSKLWEAHN